MVAEGENAPLLVSEQQPDTGLSGIDEIAVEKSLLRKLDRRMSILMVIYILNYIDRNNASAARLKGFERDLGLEGAQFANILSILYVGYVLCQVPSNMFLNYIGRPAIYLGSSMLLWGVISVATGLMTNYTGVMFTRFFLGVVEAAFFPGALFLISKWYKREELSQRTALLSCGSLISNAFGSLIASCILDAMEGRLGYAAWRWLFFIEGGLTCFFAIVATYVLPDFPETSSGWLTPAEKAMALKRMAGDSPQKDDSGSSGLILAISDPKVWWLALTLTTLVFSLSFNAYFPTLASTLGYSPTITLLLCVPPWIFATFAAVLLSRHSDRAQERCGHITFSFSLGILGFLLAIITMNSVARYCSLFLMAQSYAGFICFLAWTSSSIRPASKRAVGLALINTVSSFGNLSGSYAWPLSWGPTYRLSYSICIAASLVGLVGCWIFRAALRRLNRAAGAQELFML